MVAEFPVYFDRTPAIMLYVERSLGRVPKLLSGRGHIRSLPRLGSTWQSKIAAIQSYDLDNYTANRIIGDC